MSCSLTPEEIATLPRCATCGGIYGAECPPHATALMIARASRLVCVLRGHVFPTPLRPVDRCARCGQ